MRNAFAYHAYRIAKMLIQFSDSNMIKNCGDFNFFLFKHCVEYFLFYHFLSHFLIDRSIVFFLFSLHLSLNVQFFYFYFRRSGWGVYFIYPKVVLVIWWWASHPSSLFLQMLKTKKNLLAFIASEIVLHIHWIVNV